MRLGKRYRKRTIDHIVEINFWEGFQDGLGDGSYSVLEYSSTSGWYGYNPARHVAYDAGYALGQKVLKDHDERNPKRRFFVRQFRYEVPGEVYREAYDSVHFVWKGQTGRRPTPY